MPLHYYRPVAELRVGLGLVVPTWFPPDHDVAAAAELLAVNLADLATVIDPERTVLVADGQGVAAEAAELARERLAPADRGYRVLALPGEGVGKGGAVGRGLELLFAEADPAWLLVRDHDGDHFLHDAPRLARLALQIADETGNARILVNGGREDPARPMGWIRAEYEAVVNQLVWRGLQYHAARQAGAVDETYLDPARRTPDLQSGYKLYSRAAAEEVAESYLTAGYSARRWGCEVVATAEVVARGGIYGEVRRASFDEQPLTTYEGGTSRATIHSGIIAWTAARLGLPGEVVMTWLDSALAAGPLRLLGPAVEEVEALRSAVAEAVGVPPRALRRPWFG